MQKVSTLKKAQLFSDLSRSARSHFYEYALCNRASSWCQNLCLACMNWDLATRGKCNFFMFALDGDFGLSLALPDYVVSPPFYLRRCISRRSSQPLQLAVWIDAFSHRILEERQLQPLLPVSDANFYPRKGNISDIQRFKTTCV